MQVHDDIDKASILRGFPLFAELAPALIDELARESRGVMLQRGQAVYRVGDMPAEMYVLLTGQVKLTLSSNRGNERIIDLLEAGRSFGEAELFGTQPYLVSALAIKPTTLLAIAGTGLHRVLGADPRAALPIIKALAQRQFELEAELAAGHSRSRGRRLLEFFLGLAGPQRPATGETPVTLGISKQLLASRFAMQPETLSRTLRELAASGLIAVDGGQIRLNNAAVDGYLAGAESSPAGRHVVALPAGGDRRAVDSGPRCDPINMAGRQRMLSQRMAKSWLMLERGVLTRRSRLILKQSVAMFDRQLQDLDLLAGGAESHAARAELGEIWLPYRALLDSAPSRRGARQLFAMNEEVLAAAHKLTVSLAREDGTRRGWLVNLAGRERMLSQRMAKFFMFQQLGVQVQKCRAELQMASAEFSTALVELVEATRDAPRLVAELEQVAEQWHELRAALVVRDGANFARSAGKVFSVSEQLLQRADRAVQLCVELPA